MASRTVKPFITSVLICLILIVAANGCEKKITQPTPQPAQFNLHIAPMIDSFEPDSGANFYLKGSVTDPDSNLLSGIRVAFSVDPDSMGNIAPVGHAHTDPSKPNGFDLAVIFVGRKVGVAVIWAGAYNESGEQVSTDSLHLQVRRSPNG